MNTLKAKIKGYKYSLPSVGPGADPDVQAVSPPAAGDYKSTTLRLPSHAQSITAHWPVPSYTTW